MNATSNSVSTPDLRRWSATRLQRLLRCPRQFAFAYVDQIPTIATIPLLLGGTIHTVVSDAHTSQMVGEPFPTLEELKRDFENRFQLAVEEEQPFIRASDPKREEILVLAGAMLERFHLANSDVKAPKAVEHWFEIETEGVTLCGSIDRVDETTTGLVVPIIKPAPGVLRPKRPRPTCNFPFTLSRHEGYGNCRSSASSSTGCAMAQRLVRFESQRQPTI